MRICAWSLRRVAPVAVVTSLAVGLLASPAAAHVAVSADKAQAGATDVTLTFVGEAESTTAGIKSERVVLPAGIPPAGVSRGKLPAGWQFTANPDGFTVAGKPLPVGRDATFSVKVAKLPTDQTRLSFKTLETYGDGDVARWIEIQQAGAPEPDNPAPLLKLKPAAAAPAGTVSAPAADPTSTPAADPTSPAASDPTSTPAALADDTGSGHAVLWLVLGAVLVLAGAAAVVLRRRRSTP